MAQAWNTSTQEAGAGMLQVQVYSGLWSEFQIILGPQWDLSEKNEEEEEEEEESTGDGGT